jgi:hypothetical protein
MIYHTYYPNMKRATLAPPDVQVTLHDFLSEPLEDFHKLADVARSGNFE